MTPITTRAEALAQGSKRYFTGEPCKRGHVGYRYVVTRSCYACNQAAADAWGRSHPDKKRSFCKRSYVKHGDSYKAQAKTRASRVRDLIAVLRQEMPEMLKEFGL